MQHVNNKSKKFYLNINKILFKCIGLLIGIKKWGLGIGDWGLGIGDWGPSPNPQPPSPNPQPPLFQKKKKKK